MPRPEGNGRLASFGDGLNVAVVGASGGIGQALAAALAAEPGLNRLFALSRTRPANLAREADWLPIDITDESSIGAAAETIRRQVGRLHIAVTATGLLHAGPGFQPEKSWRSLDGDKLVRSFMVNAVGPALVAKHLLPLLDGERKAAFAALSARVGSISDNRLGGWHGYRASKAALNMLIRNLAIELARRKPDAICCALHPGTVDSPLSQPFQGSVTPARLFTPAQAAGHLLDVLDGLTAADSGGLFAWDGNPIPF